MRTGDLAVALPEAHGDGQAAAGVGVGRDTRAVGDGDRADDGEAEALPVGVPDALGAEALERLEEALDLVRRDDRAGVRHREAGRFAGRDLDPAARDVVPHRVVDEVRDEDLQQPRVTCDSRGRQRGVDPHRIAGPGIHHVPRQDRQVDGFPPLDSPLARRQRQQRVDQPLLRPPQHQHLMARRPQRVDAGVRIGEGHLQQRPLGGERCAQFVRRVRHEPLLRLERRLQPREQVVERVGEQRELVVAAGTAKPGRRCRLLAEMSRAVAVNLHRGLRKRTATSHPATMDTTAIAAARRRRRRHALHDG